MFVLKRNFLKKILKRDGINYSHPLTFQISNQICSFDLTFQPSKRHFISFLLDLKKKHIKIKILLRNPLFLLPGTYFEGFFKYTKRCFSLHMNPAFLKELLNLKAVEPAFLPKSPPKAGAEAALSS